MAASPSQPDKISVAIEVANSTQLRKLNPSHSLEEIIHGVCLDLNIPYNEGQYALQLNVTSAKIKNKYINELNRTEVKNGSMLKLVYSPREMASILIQNINANGEVYPLGDKAVWALDTLQGLATDPSFAKEFQDRQGLPIIYYLLTLPQLPHDQLVGCLITLDAIMAHKLALEVPLPVVDRIVRFVVDINNPGSEVISTSLSILAHLVADDDNEYVATNVGYKELIPHLWNQENQVIQRNVLALINKMARSNSRKLQSSVASKHMKETIAKNILGSTEPLSSDLAKELFEYQALILSYKERKLNVQIDVEGRDAASISELNQATVRLKEGTRSSIGSLLDAQTARSDPPLNKSASMQDFPLPAKSSDYHRPKSTVDRAYLEPASVNIRSDIQVVMIDSSTPVSRLTLSCMLYFARNYPKQYVRVMQAEEASWQPFPATCQRVVKLVWDVMNIRSKKASARKYQPLMFHEPAFFEEVFCRMFLQLGRTRRDMKARTKTDQEKVLLVLQRQLREALLTQPKTLKDLTKELRDIDYATISHIWLKEWKNEETRTINQSPAILELKEFRKEEVIELIRQQRINILLKGTTFPKSLSRNKWKKRSTFVVLSPNERSFHYHDCDEDGRTIPNTSGRVSMSDVTSMVTGKRCPHVIKETRVNSKFEYELAFSLLLDLEPSSSYDFIAPEQETFDYWTDAINVLLGKDMKSQTMESELKMLLDMEVRLQLLDIKTNDIPSNPPPIPSPPEDYSFQSEL